MLKEKSVEFDGLPVWCGKRMSGEALGVKILERVLCNPYFDTLAKPMAIKREP